MLILEHGGRPIKGEFILIFIAFAVLCISAIGTEYTADYWVQQGNEFFSKGSYEVALDCYNKSIELDPRNAVSWNNKGLALYYLGKYNETIRAYEKAIEIDPQYADAWGGKGDALRILGEYNESVKAYENAIKINPIYEDS